MLNSGQRQNLHHLHNLAADVMVRDPEYTPHDAYYAAIEFVKFGRTLNIAIERAIEGSLPEEAQRTQSGSLALRAKELFL